MTQLSFFGAAQPSPKVIADVCARKHGGNARSVAANKRVTPAKASTRERVRIFVAGCGYEGTTLKEICAAFGKLPHQLSGRCSELKAEGKIFDSGRVKEDHSVLVARREWVNGSQK